MSKASKVILQVLGLAVILLGCVAIASTHPDPDGTVPTAPVPGPVVTAEPSASVTVPTGTGPVTYTPYPGVTLVGNGSPGQTWLNAGPGDSVCHAPGDCGYGDNPGPGNPGNGDHFASVGAAEDAYAVCDQTVTAAPGACRWLWARSDTDVASVHTVTASTTALGNRIAIESFDVTAVTNANGYVTGTVDALTGVHQCQATPSLPISGPGTLIGASCFPSGPRSILIRMFAVASNGTVVPARHELVTVMVLAVQHIY